MRLHVARNEAEEQRTAEHGSRRGARSGQSVGALSRPTPGGTSGRPMGVRGLMLEVTELAREGRNHNRLARVREGVVVPRHARQAREPWQQISIWPQVNISM